MRKRDLGILLIAAFSVFISLQHESNFTFREAWYHVVHVDFDPTAGNAVLKSPPPIVFDLNGDGKKEVIFATPDAHIQVVEPSIPPSGETYQVARVLKQVSLTPGDTGVVPHEWRAVAMAVGYLDPPEGRIRKSSSSGDGSSGAPSAPSSSPHSATSSGRRRKRRKAVVAVVTEDWTVMCFDHNLRLMWEAPVREHFARTAVHKEVAILITNHTMHKGDRGVVIVGGSMELDPLADAEGLEEEEEEEVEEGRHRRSAREGEKLEDVSDGASGNKERHFSYYAFEGGNGTLAWQHTSKDFHRDMSALSQQLLPQHNYKLDANALATRHFGELECREYRDAVLKSLPHRWERRTDTRLQLASFHRHHRRSHKRHQHKKGVPRHPLHHHAAGAGGPHGLPPSHVAGREHDRNVVAHAVGKAVELAASGKKAKSDAHAHTHEHAHGNATAHHWWAANTVVAHLKEGIEVIHLYSGRTVCKLLLPEDTLHADINGDGVIDHIKASGAHVGERFVVDLEDGPVAVRPCWAIATSGVPPREELFNGSVCRGESHGLDLGGLQEQSWREFLVHSEVEGTDGGTTGEPVQVLAPIMMPRHEGRGTGRKARKVRPHGDVIFLNSKGELTSYATEGLHGKWGKAAHGRMRWQIVTGAGWPVTDDTVVNRRNRFVPHPSVHTAPTLAALPLLVGGPPEVILAAGESSAAVVSPGGVVLATFTMPTMPIEPLVIGDFNGDGLNDVIVITSVGAYAFVQVRQPGALLMSSLAACLIIVISVAFVTLHLKTPRGRLRGGDKRSTD